MLGAAGGVEAIASVHGAGRTALLPPTIHLDAARPGMRPELSCRTRRCDAQADDGGFAFAGLWRSQRPALRHAGGYKNPMNIKQIEALAQILAENDLSALEYQRRAKRASAWSGRSRSPRRTPARYWSRPPMPAAAAQPAQEAPASAPVERSRRGFQRRFRGQVPHGGRVLRRAFAGRGTVCRAWARKREKGRCAVHRRGHEAHERDSARSATAKSSTFARTTGTLWNLDKRCSSSTSGNFARPAASVHRPFHAILGALTMNRTEIMNILPHRDDMLLVDDATAPGGRLGRRALHRSRRRVFPAAGISPATPLCRA